jgi:hypothetical protein
MSNAVSSWAGYKYNFNAFGRRLSRLQEVVALVSQEVDMNYPGLTPQYRKCH